MHAQFTKNGITKEVKIGFSWTIFCFGWIALLIRKQWAYAAISFFTFNFASWYFMFVANKAKAHDLIDDGWAIDRSVPAWDIVKVRWAIDRSVPAWDIVKVRRDTPKI